MGFVYVLWKLCKTRLIITYIFAIVAAQAWPSRVACITFVAALSLPPLLDFLSWRDDHFGGSGQARGTGQPWISLIQHVLISVNSLFNTFSKDCLRFYWDSINPSCGIYIHWKKGCATGVRVKKNSEWWLKSKVLKACNEFANPLQI